MANPAKPPPSNACEGFLCCVDSFLSIVVFSPIVVGYWRGCWQLMDYYLFPDNPLMSLWVSLAVGLGFGILCTLLQDFFTDNLCKAGYTFRFLIVSRVYTVIFCLCCVNHWRGVWMAWDFYTGISWESGAASTGLGILTLGITRGVKNILAPPFVAVPDTKENYFHITTIFRTKKENYIFFFVDVLFTVVFTGSLVVFVWRGSWVVLDRKLFPNNPPYSAWGSLMIGMTVTILSFFGQVVMISSLRNISKGVWKILLEDIYHIVCFVGAVNVWRGVWNLLNIYLYPERPVLSNMITTVGGNLILIIFFCANSTIPIRGAEMDGAKEGASGVIFRTSFLRSFLHPKREKPTPEQFRDLGEKCISNSSIGFMDVSKHYGSNDGRRICDGNTEDILHSEDIKYPPKELAEISKKSASKNSPNQEGDSDERESFI